MKTETTTTEIPDMGAVHRHLKASRAAARLMVAHQTLAGHALCKVRDELPEQRGPKAPVASRGVWAGICRVAGLSYKQARHWMDIASRNPDRVAKLNKAQLPAPKFPAKLKGETHQLSTSRTLRALLEELELIPPRQTTQPRPKSTKVTGDTWTREPLALPREIAKRQGYQPVAGPYQVHEAAALARALAQLSTSGAPVALVGSEIWRRTK